MYCEENNCEQAECHRCFPVSGCDDHQKCRSITHPEIGATVLYDHPANGTAKGIVREILGLRGSGWGWPYVLVESEYGGTFEIQASWINWRGDPWNREDRKL